MTVSRPRRSLGTYLEFVKFEHTLFALPFAYAGMLLAAGGAPGWRVFAWVTLAMVGARTAAMAMNRLIDAEIDARNPRTADRALPAGRLRPRDAWALALAGFALLALAGAALNPLTLTLLPVAVAFLALYPYSKRFTWACHLWLGVTIGAAAAGGFIAVTGRFEPAAWLLWAAVASWIAGFDVIYGLLDLEVDRAQGIHSIPARFGRRGAEATSAGLHALTLVSLLALPAVAPLGGIYLLAVGAGVAPLLGYQQWLVRRRGATSALRAFNANLWLSLLVLAGLATDLWTGSPGG